MEKKEEKYKQQIVWFVSMAVVVHVRMILMCTYVIVGERTRSSSFVSYVKYVAQCRLSVFIDNI